MKKDFKIIQEAIRYQDSLLSGTEGYIVEYEDELYFVHKEKDIDIYSDEIWTWTFDIERKFCVDEIDEDFYRYYDLKNNRITFENWRKEILKWKKEVFV